MINTPSLKLLGFLCGLFLISACGSDFQNTSGSMSGTLEGGLITGPQSGGNRAEKIYPKRLKVNAGDGEVTISWNAVADGDSYNLYWNRSGDLDMTDGEVINTHATWFVHKPVVNGDTYYYRVSFLNNQGESDLTAMAAAIPGLTHLENRQDSKM